MTDSDTRVLHAQIESVSAALNEYVCAKSDFDTRRLDDDHYEWKERHLRLRRAENRLFELAGLLRIKAW